MPDKTRKRAIDKPSLEAIDHGLGRAENLDDFFGKDGLLAQLFADMLERILQAELTDHLGYEPYEVQGRNTGNSRNGSYQKTVRTSTGGVVIDVPRDRNSEYEPRLLKKYQTSSNELEDKIVGLYAKGMTTRDIEDHLGEL